MTLTVREVVARSQRLFGGIASGDGLVADEAVDMVTVFNAMQRGFFGDLIGPRLSPLAAGAALTAENGGVYQIAASLMTITAPANPRNGWRFGVADANLNFTTNTCTIARNGRLLEGAASNISLTTNGDNRTWFFRGDTANWVKETDLTIDATVHFPDPLVAYLPDMLAVYAVAEYGGEVRPDIVAKAALGRETFARVYQRRGRNAMDRALTVGGSSAQ